jgi:glycosyltransferase involved in cell wall biosynthesis
MKILWMSHRDIKNPRAGGAERTIYEVGRRLVLRGHEVEVLTGGWHGADRHETIEGVHFHRYGGMVTPHLVLPQFIRYHSDADVVVDDMAHAAPWFSPWFSDIPGVVFFRHLHARTLSGQTSLPLAKFLSWMERRYPFIYRRWPFVTESMSSKHDLMDLGIADGRVYRIPPGVDGNLFQSAKKSERPSIIYFGGMRPYKRPEHALIAFKLLLDSGISAELVIVGDGPSMPLLKSLSSSLNIDRYVKFRGHVSRDELAKTLAASWVNVHCSLSEGWGYSIMEAASSGTPTVAYDVPGVSETVVDRETGLLVRDGDVASLASAIGIAISTNVYFPDRCRKHAEQYSWDRTAEMWESILSGVCSRDKS